MVRESGKLIGWLHDRFLGLFKSGGDEQGDQVHTAELQGCGHLPLRMDQEEVERRLPHHQPGNGRGGENPSVGSCDVALSGIQRSVY